MVVGVIKLIESNEKYLHDKEKGMLLERSKADGDVGYGAAITLQSQEVTASKQNSL